jgi:hypothetical protein
MQFVKAIFVYRDHIREDWLNLSLCKSLVLTDYNDGKKTISNVFKCDVDILNAEVYIDANKPVETKTITELVAEKLPKVIVEEVKPKRGRPFKNG